VKLLIGVLSLLAAFAAAALWQSRWHAEAEARREALRAGAPSSIEIAPEDEAPGWGRVIIGRPSGADPVERGALAAESRGDASSPPRATTDTRMPNRAPSAAAPSAAAPSAAAPTSAAQTPLASSPRASATESKIVVAPGQSLSTICQSRYGTSRPEVVQALARYNGLKDANALRAGDTLRAPPLEQLLATGR
jgi:hypothetical protein